MLLQKQAAIQFDLTEVMYSVATFLGEQRFASNFLKNDGDRPLLAHYNTVRAVGIALLQNRDYTIEQRIILLAIYLDKLSQAEADDRPAHLPAVIDTFVKAVEERLYDKLLASGGGAVTATVISNIAAITAFSQNSLHPIVVRCNTGITTIDFPRRMDSYRTFMAGREHLLEHLLVMELFTKAMPFTNKRSITDCIQYMVSIFTIFRFMLGAYLGESPELTEAEFIDFVAFFGKSVLHSSGSFDTNIGLLKESGMDTLPHWISIVLG